MLKIRELRIEKGITQKNLAEILNIPANTFNQYENGKREPDYSTVKKIANYFDVTTDYLLENSDIKNKPSSKDNGLSEKALKLVKVFGMMSEENQDKLLELADVYIAAEKQRQQKK